MSEFDTGILIGCWFGIAVTVLGFVFGIWALRRYADYVIVRKFTRRG